MDTGTVVRQYLTHEPNRCMWQIRPDELPADLPPMALELWMDAGGKLHLFQFLLEDREEHWYQRIIHCTRFEQMPPKPIAG